jgi:uridine kinase
MRDVTDKTVAVDGPAVDTGLVAGISYDELAARILALAGNVRLVAVDGCGGAGKSTLAAGLSAALGGCPIVHTDDFASWDEPLGWWPRMLTEVLQPLARGERATFRRYDWEARRLGDQLIVEPEPVVIVEGVSSSRSEWAQLLAFTIWVETPRPVRLQRGLDRDGVGLLAQWEAWMAAEDDYVARDRPDVRADVVVDGTSER